MSTKQPRVALIHYWYLRRRGGERVLDVLAEMYPDSDIFIMLADRAAMLPATQKHKLTTSFLQNIPGSKRHYRSMMALYPLALEQFDLRDYDLVISQEAGMAKCVLTRTRTCHINYCHSPMRYVWEMYHDYKQKAPFGALGKAFYALSANYVRQADYLAAMRVNSFIASSKNSAKRIRSVYGRPSEIVLPPVDFSGLESGKQREEFYLVVSPLVAYKRVDLAIKACNQLRKKLFVIGAGEELNDLKRMAGPTIEFLGNVPDDVVRDYYSRCRAFLFPGEEDIGLTPIEAQGSGAPVIAFRAGGVLETVIGASEEEEFTAKSTGFFFSEQSETSLAAALQRFETNETVFSAQTIAVHASQFNADAFKQKMSAVVDRNYLEFLQQ